MGVLIVISNAFKQFSKNPNLLSYDKLLSLLHHHDINATELVGRRLIAGQGLDDMQVNHAWYIGNSLGLRYEFAYWRIARKGRYADQTLCHKHRPENILISVPEQQSDGTYIADLFFMVWILAQAGSHSDSAYDINPDRNQCANFRTGTTLPRASLCA